jgi:hypothetical protein
MIERSVGARKARTEHKKTDTAMPEIYDQSTVQQLTREGEELIEQLHVPPIERRDLDFGQAIKIVSVELHPLSYSISAELPRMLTHCVHCGQDNLMRHGRYVVRLADLPYVDSDNRVMPVQYAIKAQRYKCGHCGLGDVEPLPAALRPVVTNARITRRLSMWLLYAMQTQTPYDTIARMTGYSKVWARKWFMEVRAKLGLPPKPSKPGRKKKA